MKKSLVLAIAMALGVTASAYAANPFADVPAGHWAYDSISKLAAAGVIEGYGDDTFRGDRLMTRYEMAQIVAKAMAKGANVDKLAAEFADELDALGVRVAALEKKADNVKITGHFRYHYASVKNAGVKSHETALRSRLWFTGKVNDNWNYVGMLQNWQDLSDNTGNDNVNFQRAYLEGRLGGMHVVAGRHDFQLGDANLYDTRMDGIKVSYGKKVKVGAYYGKPSDVNGGYGYELRYNGTPKLVPDDGAWYSKFFGANVGYENGKFFVNAAYDKFKDAKNVAGADVDMKDNGVWSIQAGYNFGKASLGAIYLKSNVDAKYNNGVTTKDASTDGVVLTATYGGAERDKVGSWGLVGKYYNQGAGTFIAHTMDGRPEDFYNEGFSGYSIAGYVTVAKNMIAGVAWYDIEGRESNNKKRTLWSEMAVSF